MTRQLKTTRYCVAVAFLTLGVACDNPFGSGDCTLLVRPAVTIEVRETGSGRSLADSAKGVVRTGTYVDSLKPSRSDASGVLVALQGGGTAGTYSIELVRPGYAVWTRSNVHVTGERCSVHTVDLRADLVRPGA